MKKTISLISRRTGKKNRKSVSFSVAEETVARLSELCEQGDITRGELLDSLIEELYEEYKKNAKRQKSEEGA